MPGPLASLKVLDFSTLLPGPFASLLLADMGAEVLRIESPTRMDLLRVLPPHDQGVSASHAYLNRNKRSLALDLKQPEALEVIKQLLQDHDIVLEQFRPGVMERLGLGYEALKAINPKLIYVSITGYGQTGPYKDRAGHDINYLALAGLASYTGRADSGPLPLGIQAADIAGGSLHGVIGLLAAVIARQQTGQGQYLDVSMTDCAFSLNAMAGAGYLACGVEPEREDQMLNGGSFYDYYRSRDGRWLSVGSLEPAFMQQLCTVLGRPELAVQGLSPKPEQQQALKNDLKIEFEKHDFSELCELFAGVDACVEPVLSVGEAVRHPQLQARGLVTEVPRGDGSTQQQMACPLKFSEGLPAPRYIGAAVGQHTDQVLGELGFSAQRIEELRRAKVVV
ncbi:MULTISPECIES: CaiB/BaiF CoA transferase family protein [unclassified Pseudomonas]|uniref:CaiB/BaiF CoA transferase family protein n=1 Tax=unclassified Pseudomonas TaxID=196821 RepID=UPI0019137D57|nr:MULTISPECIES: CaiB/BaiF CoA-transferase family protein [unclassified Pseudomonas]MBK5513382.1 CoA transferase [Pseudomonas sp. TH15]MBK5548714.1 CoA transferase [Pseudomonas sp. TH03]MEB0225839.1 CaiB/BaiF CoA-transferase family protein [Pseudomonas sp. 5S1]MEB0298960.1 CaiB/BaiF CoA-transferase family protein [Pseudomonas sp. 10S4]WPX18608.1 CaiB/BaiF CoA-transferase family protein [Pseudomonas sp. 10S4]